MDHLSRQQIFALIDGQLDDADERRYNAHLAGCVRCRREAQLQRSLGRTVHHLPLEKTSARFTERTMNRILHVRQQSLSYKILQHVGSAAAMVAVLVVLGYILNTPSKWVSGSESSTMTGLTNTWEAISKSLTTFISKSTTQLNTTVATQTSTPTSKIVVMTLLVLLGYAALDRFVLKKVIRMKL